MARRSRPEAKLIEVTQQHGARMQYVVAHAGPGSGTVSGSHRVPDPAVLCHVEGAHLVGILHGMPHVVLGEHPAKITGDVIQPLVARGVHDHTVELVIGLVESDHQW